MGNRLLERKSFLDKIYTSSRYSISGCGLIRGEIDITKDLSPRSGCPRIASTSHM